VVEYVTREATLSLEISVSDPDKEGPDEWRPATLVFAPFVYCVIEPPDDYPDMAAKPLLVDAGSEDLEGRATFRVPTNLPPGAFTCWFFISNWNSFIHFAALDASLVFD
jgi:hypothetical protein